MCLNSKSLKNDYLSLTLSVLVHLLLLLLVYFLRAKRSTTLAPRVSQVSFMVEKKSSDAISHNRPAEQPNRILTSNKSKPKHHDQSQPQESIQQPENSPTVPYSAEQNEATTDHTALTGETQLDQRALYGNEEPASGASLVLPGWIWDHLPSLKDQTDEVGTLIFEITINDMGEMIAIKTLEKNVSPVVEQFYKDEIAKLTFSKTNAHSTYQPTYTGKITFHLQYKKAD